MTTNDQILHDEYRHLDTRRSERTGFGDTTVRFDGVEVPVTYSGVY